MRCGWAKNDLAIRYHDTEWGVPVHDDRTFFEFLILEGAQAGLSWDTILRRRENYRNAFNNFDAAKIALYDKEKCDALMQNAGIIRNRLKIKSAVNNARHFLEIQKDFGTFDAYIWHFTDGKTVKNSWKALSEIPASTPLSDRISKDLKKRGFSFVGSTIIYAFCQATGIVNDHLTECFRYNEV